ncbi:reverse transcriptase [Elysia marginata]|uniref:Reverse transcriptase n=1 Tax=Elysia marginata TaxID=1093978 RepID=A0AAV4I4Q3_9GAST|nr:reverse transcriptase [Elysia marginata]
MSSKEIEDKDISNSEEENSDDDTHYRGATQKKEGEEASKVKIALKERTLEKRLDTYKTAEKQKKREKSGEKKDQGNQKEKLMTNSFGFTDHGAVMTTLNFQTFKHGPSFYKLNTSLLNDPNYVDMINKYLDEADRKFQDLDLHLKWEMLKIEIAEISQEFSKAKNPQRKIETDVKQQQLNELEQFFSKDPNNQEHIDRINKLKHELEIRCMEGTKGAQLRAGIKWIEEGERGTQFFLNLEKNSE